MWCGKHIANTLNMLFTLFRKNKIKLNDQNNQTNIDLFLFFLSLLTFFPCRRYPNVHDPEDNILALKKRAALQFNVEDISDYVLLLDGDEVDSDV